MGNEKKRIWCGLDVSKKDFVAAIDNAERFTPVQHLKTKIFPRTTVGAGSLLKWLRSFLEPDQTICIIMETTGCYSKELAKYIYDIKNDSHITIQNGRSISDFIKSLNINKSDITDAQAIARFGSDRNPAPTRREEQKWSDLREYERERTALIEVKVALEHRKDSLFCKTTKTINGRAIQALTLQIKAIDKEIEKLIRHDDEMLHEVRIMSSFPGVAFISASNLLAEYGSLKQYTSRELSQLSGLAPRTFQSGTSLNKSYMSRRGSKRARQILYIDSISAVNKVPFLKDMFNRIVASGKCNMTARCACMRKILLILRAMVVNDKKYDEKILENFRKRA